MSMDRNAMNFNGGEFRQIAISPKPYALLGEQKNALRSQGIITTRKALADKAILAAYGKEGVGNV